MQYDISKYISQKEFNNKCRGNFDLPIDTPIIIRQIAPDRFGYELVNKPLPPKECMADDCTNMFQQNKTGRPRLYCSDTCRYRMNKRQWRKSHLTLF